MAIATAVGYAACAAGPAWCRTDADLRQLDGRRVRLVGVYGPVPVPLRKRDPPVHLGHAAVTVGDVRVRIGRGPRPLEELARLQGKVVVVEGRLRMHPPLRHPPHVAQPLPPPTLFEPGDVRPLAE